MSKIRIHEADQSPDVALRGAVSEDAGKDLPPRDPQILETGQRIDSLEDEDTHLDYCESGPETLKHVARSIASGCRKLALLAVKLRTVRFKIQRPKFWPFTTPPRPRKKRRPHKRKQAKKPQRKSVTLRKRVQKRVKKALDTFRGRIALRAEQRRERAALRRQIMRLKFLQILLALSAFTAKPIVWYARRKEQRRKDRAHISPQRRCPACGFHGCRLNAEQTSEGMMVACSCLMCGAKSYEPPILRSDAWAPKMPIPLTPRQRQVR